MIVRIRAVDDLGKSTERVINLQISQQITGTTSWSTGVTRGNTGSNGSINVTTESTGATSVTTVDTTRLNSIISTFSSTDITKVNYGISGRFPELNFPTGATQPHLPNPTDIDIQNKKLLQLIAIEDQPISMILL